MARGTDRDPRWRRRVAKLAGRLLSGTRDRPTVSEPKQVDGPIEAALLVRGVSSWNDTTFARLESELPAGGIEVIRFSYRGIDQPTYEPCDTIVDIRAQLAQMDRYIQGSTGVRPRYLLGHSLGGLVIANWICRTDGGPDHQKVLDDIAAVVFLGAPLFPPYPWIRIHHPTLDQEVDFVLAPFDLRPLVQRLSRIKVVIGAKDPVAPREYASVARHFLGASSVEEVLVDAGHLNICNHDDAVDAVIRWLGVA